MTFMDIQSPKLLVVWKRNYIKTYVLYTILNCYSAISVCILNCRFDVSTVELLLWYEAIFGREMWKHVVSETTFWSHSEEGSITFDTNLNNYFNVHVYLSVRKLTPVSAVVSPNVTNRSFLACVKSEKFAFWIEYVPELGELNG